MALRELILSIRTKVDRSGIEASDKAVQQATKSAGFLERAMRKVEEVQRRVNSTSAKASQAFAQSFGSVKGKARSAHKDALKIDNGELLGSLTEKPKTALEALREKFNSTFTAAGQRIQQVTATVDGFAAKLFSARTAMAGFAAVIVGSAIKDFIGSVVDAGGALSEMSQRTRVSVQSLYAWGQLAADNSIDAGVLESSFRKLSKSMRASEKGTSAQAKAFALLGVDAKNANGIGLRPVEDVLIDVGVALNQMEDDATATALATQLLGPSGYGLVPAFEAGGDAVRKYLKTAKEMAPLSASEAASLDEIGDATERASKRLKGLKDRLVVAMIPALDWLSRKFEAVSTWLFVAAKQSKVFETILGMLAAGGIARLVVLFASWVAKIGGARAAMALFGGGLRTAAGFALRFLAPLLLIEDFLTFLAGGKSLFGRAFNEIFGEGGAQEMRQKFLDWGTKAKEVLGELGQLAKNFAGNSLFTGAIKGALDAILATLNLIGGALADDAEKAEELNQKFLARTAPKPGSGLDKVPEFSQKAGGFLGDIDDQSSWFQRARKRAQNLLQPNRDVVHGRLANAINSAGPNMSGAQNSSPVPPAMVAGSAANVSRNVTINDKRTVEVNVTSTSNPGAVGRAVAQSVSQNMSQDPRQVLQSISE